MAEHNLDLRLDPNMKDREGETSTNGKGIRNENHPTSLTLRGLQIKSTLMQLQGSRIRIYNICMYDGLVRWLTQLLASKPDDLSSISGTHMVEESQLL